MARYVYNNNDERLLSLDPKMMIWIIDTVTWAPMQVPVSQTRFGWILFTSRQDCEDYYQDIF